ncbi:ferredoxin [Streptomyces sp. NPDC000134]|jgi:ferredoxin|uniref:ferredoxin n=1 Tax=Streptomyces sp. NPDC000134 TaxID=3364536 RepID=UPI0036773E8B
MSEESTGTNGRHDEKDAPGAAPRLWRVTVDSQSCVGSGMCRSIAGKWFAADGREAGAGETLGPPDGALLDAAEICPGQALTVVEEASGRLIAPDTDPPS